MFDHLNNQSDDLALQSAWRDDVRHGDILAFRFPLAEDGATGEAKLRPCLVLDIVTIAGTRYALLAYGTSGMHRGSKGYRISVTRPEALAALGLRKATNFEGYRRIVVSLSNGGFQAPIGKTTPLIGRLVGEEFERLNAVRARIHAEADIAAAARTERRRGRTGPRPFTVETRPRRRVSLPTRNRTTARAMPRRAL